MNMQILSAEESQIVSGAGNCCCQFWNEYYSRCFRDPLAHELHYSFAALAVGTVMDLALMTILDYGVPYVGIISGLLATSVVLKRQGTCYPYNEN